MFSKKRYKVCLRRAVFPLAFVGFSGAAGGAAVPPAGTAPVTHTINLGPQLPGQILTEKETVANPGTTTMRFSRVITSCGCAGGELRPALLPPGKTATLNMRLTTLYSPGVEAVSAMLYGRAGTARVIRQYRFEFSVHRMIRISGPGGGSPDLSYYLNLGTISAGAKPAPFRLLIRRGGYPGHWDTLGCSANSARIAAGLKQSGRNNWRLSLLPKNLTILGSQSYLLRFSFHHKGKELPYHYSVPVSFKVRGPMELAPDSVFFGAVPYGSTLVKRLRLVTSEEGQAGKGRIVSARSAGPGHAVVSVTDDGAGLRAAFHAIGTPGRATGRFLVTAEYRGEKYDFRVDYLAYVVGNQGAK